MNKRKSRMARIDKRLASTRKILRKGKKVFALMREDDRTARKEERHRRNRDFESMLQDLIKAQWRTDAQIQALSVKIDRLVDSWGKNGGNGHRG